MPGWENPLGTDGFAFVECAAPDAKALDAVFQTLGFGAVARHRSRDLTLYRQGEINFIVNAEPDGGARAFAEAHGPSVSAMAFRVADAEEAYRRLIGLGARPIETRELDLPAIEGIGGSLLYLIDGAAERRLYGAEFVPIPGADQHPAGVGLTYLDHLTHNVHRGRMALWADTYARLFNFREIRHFDIEGKLTGLRSKAMTSPCGKIRIPINESADDRSQIVEYLEAYKGEGIQHIAFGTSDIYRTVETLRRRGVNFLETIDSYYDLVDQRLPGHGEDVGRLKANQIQIDGAPGAGGGRLLQIFTATVIGPIFFEIIQRKGDEGFGEGNFKALFEAMELDQIRRGVLRAGAEDTP